MGRPPKNPKDRRTYQLHIPLTEAGHDIIKQAVESDGRDKADWARTVLLDTAKRKIAKDSTRKTDGA